MKTKAASDEFSEAEAKRRFDETLRRALNTPPTLHKTPAKKSNSKKPAK